jgi:hypothetical protein
MKISNQVCTLEQAKRLKELGVCQESYFHYGDHMDGVFESWMHEGDEDTFYAAFTVAELGAMLKGCETYPRKSDRNDYWFIYLEKFEHFKTEAEGRAAILIYRLEKGASTIAEVNHLLQAD